VPHPALTAERLAVEHGGLCLNVSAMARAAAERTVVPRGAGTAVIHAGMAPGVTSLVATALLSEHPDADEVEVVLTNGGTGSGGPASKEFGHRNLTTVDRHATRTVPLPEPYGTRECLEFAEPERGWLGSTAGSRRVRCLLCLLDPRAHDALLSLNAAGEMRSLPNRPDSARPAQGTHPVDTEPIRHWVSVLRSGRRLAARSIECAGDFPSHARATEVLCDWLLTQHRAGSLASGVIPIDEVMGLADVVAPLREAQIAVVDRTGGLDGG